MTPAEFIEDAEITMDVDSVTPGVGTESDPWPHLCYKVTLRCEGRTLTTEFKNGIGCVDWTRFRQRLESSVPPSCGDIGQAVAEQIATIALSMTRQFRKDIETQWKVARTAKLAHDSKCGTDPDVDQVLWCLISDAVGPYWHRESFEDWASNYGYDTDSRRAEATYNACRSEGESLAVLLGNRTREAFEDVEED